ncbi:ATP-binding protein, partial [Staphylococcus shinii]
MYYKKKFMGVVTALICFFILYMANFTSLWVSSLISDTVIIKNNYVLFLAISFTVFSFVYAY